MRRRLPILVTLIVGTVWIVCVCFVLHCEANMDELWGCKEIIGAGRILALDQSLRGFELCVSDHGEIRFIMTLPTDPIILEKISDMFHNAAVHFEV